MPGAPLEPGKALKEGGGPYGFPGAINHISCLFSISTFLHGEYVPPYGLYAMFAIAGRVVNLAPKSYS